MYTSKSKTKGLLMVFTGNGKGKTTSAIGMAMRAAGHGMKIFFMQFIKSEGDYGELESLKRFSDTIEFHTIGNGFTWKSEDIEEDKRQAGRAWVKAKQAIFSDNYHMVILDEFTYLMLFGMVERQEVMQVFEAKPDNLHLIITGRSALQEIKDIADLVTDMTPVKHPYDSGVVGQKGVEY